MNADTAITTEMGEERSVMWAEKACHMLQDIMEEMPETQDTLSPIVEAIAEAFGL
jgi:hypothetical protein